MTWRKLGRPLPAGLLRRVGLAVRGNLRAFGCIAAILAALAAGAALHEAADGLLATDRPEAGPEAAALRQRVSDLERELRAARAAPGVGAGELQIELATVDELRRHMEMLESENGRLKEDLALFENLATADGAEPGVTLSGLRVEPDSVSGSYRYRFLAAFRGSRSEKEFRGSYQLLIGLKAGEAGGAMIVPAAGDADRARYDLSFRFFRRVDGSFTVPEGSRPVSVEVRLTQDGVTRAFRSTVH